DNIVEPPWTVILVDEYQDVNPAQAAFLQALLIPRVPGRAGSGARLAAVGDDWQAIFGFQGGDVELIRRFNDPAVAHETFSERIELKRTYRFGQPIADSTLRFVTRGKGAIDRDVVGSPKLAPDSRWPCSIVLASSKLTLEGERRFGKNPKGLTGGVLAALARAAEQYEDPDVLIVARRNAVLEKSDKDGTQGVGIDRKAINRAAKLLGARLTYSTVHKAKGTQADYVILLHTGPPRAGKAAANRVLERALRVFRGTDTAAEEERRIWYVALSRAMRKIYIILSADTHSPFADEIYYNERGHYDVGEDELAEFLEPMRPPVPCPTCRQIGPTTAVLAMRDGRNSRFAGCTSFA
ncbi:MAG: AAA family ATPase, partial [Proteobacteria bacterium]|nr:AAA family ATPase [Pseudomonadota bacterium]